MTHTYSNQADDFLNRQPIKKSARIKKAIKNQLAAVLDFIGENEANQILQYVRDTFLLKPKTWDDIEEDEPLPDEIEAFEEYNANK